MSVWSVRRSVNGAQITTSTSSRSSFSIRYESFCVNWIATKWSWCIFQFAAMIGLRSVMKGDAPRASRRSVGYRVRSARAGRGLAQRRQSGEIALLDELERRASSGAHVIDLGRETEL